VNWYDDPVNLPETSLSCEGAFLLGLYQIMVPRGGVAQSRKFKALSHPTFLHVSIGFQWLFLKIVPPIKHLGSDGRGG
jgi:hypothetical protein